MAELAATYDIALAIEFYAPSQVKTLSEALVEIDKTGRSDVGVTLDFDHVPRGGDVDASFVFLNYLP